MRYRSQIRASDADRELVAERLRRAAAEGRLLTHELEERLAATLRARTYGDLDALVSDLPPEPPVELPRPRQIGWLRPLVALAVAVPLAMLAISAVLFVLTGLAGLWLPWLIIVWAMLGGVRVQRRRLRGGGYYRLRGPYW